MSTTIPARLWPLMFLLAACGGDDDDDDPSRGRGSDACRDFQDAACDYAVDRCHAISRAQCDQMFQSLACKSDAQASACANALNDATCGVARPECNLLQVVDAQPAIESCEALVDAFCSQGVACGQFADRAECSAQTAGVGIDCAQALGVTLAYEECFALLEELACGAALPAQCAAVILVQPPGL